MQRRDRGLELILARSAQAHRALERPHPLGDPGLVPQRAVLIFEGHVAPLPIDARGSTRVVQQHQREQPPYLGVVGHQPGQQKPEADRLDAQLIAHQPIALGGRVALVEDEIHDSQHAAQALGELLVGGHAIADVRIGDLALGAHDALAHRRLGDQERARDLGRGQAAQRAQRQCDPRAQIERRMAAGEDQPQPVIDDGALLAHRRVLLLLQAHELGQPLGAPRHRALATQAIDRPSPRRDHDPPTWVRWDSSRGHVATAAANASCTASSASWKSPTFRIRVASTAARSSRNARAAAAAASSSGGRRSLLLFMPARQGQLRARRGSACSSASRLPSSHSPSHRRPLAYTTQHRSPFGPCRTTLPRRCLAPARTARLSEQRASAGAPEPARARAAPAARAPRSRHRASQRAAPAN